MSKAEDEMFQQIVADLQRGKKTLDSLDPDESELFARKAREREEGPPKQSPEFQHGANIVPELSDEKAFARMLEENLHEFMKGLDARTKMMVMVLGRELKSRRPAARLQAARLLGEVLGVFKRRKDGGISPDSGTSGDGSVSELERMLDRGSSVEEE